MPTGNLSLFDLFALQRDDPIVGLIEDVTTLAPEFDVVSATARPGTWYEIVRRVALPTAGFRNVNAGSARGKSWYRKDLKEMFYLDAPINLDEAVQQGGDNSVGDAFTLESQGAMRQAMITLGAQFYYGRSNDAKGFYGLRDQVSQAIAAGGTTNTTSAYLCWMDTQGVRFDVGNNGTLSMRPPFRQQITDSADSTKTYFAWVSNLSCWIGLTVGSDKAVFAVTGIDSGSTNVLTDSIAQQVISLIPIARRQNLHWFLNRTSQYSLQKSRTTVNLSGAWNGGAAFSTQPADADGRPAWSPLPDNLCGYPITLTDSITNTESN
jgi:hypothetical protein